MFLYFHALLTSCSLRTWVNGLCIYLVVVDNIFLSPHTAPLNRDGEARKPRTGIFHVQAIGFLFIVAQWTGRFNKQKKKRTYSLLAWAKEEFSFGCTLAMFKLNVLHGSVTHLDTITIVHATPSQSHHLLRKPSKIKFLKYQEKRW